jgi:hypothetical protein
MESLSKLDSLLYIFRGDSVSGENSQTITITQYNRSKTGPFLTADYKLLASFCFTLSAAPTEEWMHAFEQVRHERGQQTPSTLPPRTRIDSHGIVITCRPDDLQQHYDRLKADVAAANQRHREAQETIARDEDLLRTMDSAIEAALGKLKP